jgi:hypothetical protein
MSHDRKEGLDGRVGNSYCKMRMCVPHSRKQRKVDHAKDARCRDKNGGLRVDFIRLGVMCEEAGSLRANFVS